jgi:hypothetical protein
MEEKGEPVLVASDIVHVGWIMEITIFFSGGLETTSS